MSAKRSFKLSQDYQFVPTKENYALPILLVEWNHIKDKIVNVKFELGLYQMFGMLFIGVGISTFISLITNQISLSSNKYISVICWIIIAGCLLIGILLLYFGYIINTKKKSNIEDIVSQMDLIEKKYKLDSE